MEILGCCDISITLILVAGVLLFIYLYGKRRNQFLQSYGISGPEPTIYFGNFLQMIAKGLDFKNQDGHKYGKVYGVYLGGFPVVTVSDPEIVKQILIKHFDKFSDRLHLNLDDFPFNKGLFFEHGAVWRRLRNISSPTFSASKLRMMCDRMNKCADSLIENLLALADAKSDVKIKDYFGAYTMDVIASTGFGIEADSQNDLNNQLMTKVKEVFTGVELTSPFTLLALLFPATIPLLRLMGASTFPRKSVKYIAEILTQMIKERKADTIKGEKHRDFLQLLIDAEDEGGDEAVPTGESKKMNHVEILGQAVQFFLAGYETTATTLHFAAYALATNPDVQERLFEEISSVLGEREPDYDNIGELPLLDRALTETLRLYPVVPTLTRSVDQTVTIKGHTFPKGAFINIPTIITHRDPEIYPEPSRFNPDRWERKSEIDPMNYLPFGHGPRHCLGMRLAQVEMRIALAHVIKKVRFLPAEGTPSELDGKDFKVGGTLSTKKPIMLRVERR